MVRILWCARTLLKPCHATGVRSPRGGRGGIGKTKVAMQASVMWGGEGREEGG